MHAIHRKAGAPVGGRPSITEKLRNSIHFAHNVAVPLIHPAPPIFRHAIHHLNDPDEFGVALSGGTLVADFLGPQAEPTRVEQFQTPDWALDFHEAHVKARVFCPLPRDWASIGLMRSPSESLFLGFSAQPGLLVCNPPGEAIDGRIAPGFMCASVNVPLSVWEQSRMIAGAEGNALRGMTAFLLPPPVYVQLDRKLTAIRRLLRASGAAPHLARPAVREAAVLVAEIFTTAWEVSENARPPRDSLRNRAHLVRRAEAWMREHLGDAVQMPDVCLALRVSRRELEYAFRTVLDQSPRDFLQALRLNAIRRTLRQARTRASIVEIALDHGVTHLGRFAAHYRALFGEAPSRTRER